VVDVEQGPLRPLEQDLAAVRAPIESSDMSATYGASRSAWRSVSVTTSSTSNGSIP
jgi:hypothetical protein